MTHHRIQDSIILLIKLLVLISATKNIIYWKYPLINSGELFHYPLIPWLAELPQYFYIALSLASFCLSLLIFFSKSTRVFAWVLIFCGLTNLTFQFADYLGLHHDMYLSGLSFIAIGLYFLNPNKSNYGVILAIAASTYLLSGIYKLNPDFINGSMTVDIIGRSSRYFYGEAFSYFAELAVWLSIFAILVEIIEPFFLVFGNLRVKKLSILATLPFHIGILATGTGTVYNLTYPALFWFLVYFHAGKEKPANTGIDFFHFSAIQLTMVVSLIYLIFLGSMIPNLVAAIGRRLI